MDKNIYLAASLICADFLNLEKDIISLKKSKVDYIHFDVMDGLFVPRYGLFPEILRQVKSISDIPVDIHMMVEDAEKYIDTFISYGATKYDIFTVHAETTKHLNRVIRNIKKAGMQVGIAINPATSLEVLTYVLDDIDMVMLMAINPGIVGHPLLPLIFTKIADLKKLIGNKKILLGVDGGVNFESAPKMVQAGANFLVGGSQTIFKPESRIGENIADLRRILK